jgi:hypothetical protein
MDKETKKKYLEDLFSNELFKKSLDNVKSEEERNKIKAFAEDVFLNFIEGVLTSQKIVEENPEKVADVLARRIPKE